MKKKVLFILATNKYSGAENVAITIINNMNDKYEFAYSSPDGEIKKQLTDNNIKFIPMKKLSLSEVKKVIKKYNPDIIHANDFRASFLSSLVKGNRKLVTHIHNNVPWLGKKGINSRIFLYTAKHSEKVLIVSESIRNEFIYSNRLKDKFSCVDNPVYRSKILNAVDNYDKEFDICCVARVSSQKNPFRFLEVIKNVKNVIDNINVIWVGGIDETIKTDLEKTIDKYNLSNNVSFIGFDENPFKFMAKSKIFLLTSDWEGYGLVAFEALTLGLPSIVSKVGGLVNIVDDKCGKLCDKSDTSEYSNEIIKLLTDNNYYQKKSKEAIVKSKKLENIESYCKKLDNLYKTL